MQAGTTERVSAPGLSLAGVMVLLVVLYLVRLGAAPLFDVDEGAFAEATREMLSSGDWGHTLLNGADRFDKPILVYWLQAASMAVFGVTEFAARLPSALCTLAAAYSVGHHLRSRWGESAAALAALMLGTALGFVAIGRAATADGLLNALIVMIALSLWRFVEGGSQRDLRWAYFWTGLGLLAKGPVAVLVPGGALLLWSLLSDRGRSAWRAAWSPSGWLIVLAVAAPWYVYALNRHGMAFVDGFLLKHNVERFSGAMEGHSGGLAYYLVVWPLLCLPWTPLMAAVVWRAKALWREPLTRFLMVWALWVLAFFSLSGTKLPHYLLYGTAPMLMLMARVGSEATRGWRAMVWLSALTTGVALTVSGHVAWHWAQHIANPWYRLLITESADHLYLMQAAAVFALLWLALCLARFWRRPGAAFAKPMPVGEATPSSVLGEVPTAAPVASREVLGAQRRMAWAAWAASMAFTVVALPWWGQTLQSPFKAAGEWAQAQGMAITQWRLHHPSVAFYAQAIAPRRAPREHEWALTLLSKGPLPEGARVVWELKGVALVANVREEAQP